MFNINYYRKRNIIVGIVTLVCAIFLIAASVVEQVLKLPISLTDVVFASLLLIYTVSKFVRRRFFTGFIWAAFTFFAAEKNIAVLCCIESGNIAPNFAVFVGALFLGWGTSKIFRRSYGGFNFVKINGMGFGGKTVSVDACDLDGMRVENNMSGYTLNIKNEDSYMGDATVYICRNFGPVTLKVPPSWHIIEKCESNTAKVYIREQNGMPGEKLYVCIQQNYGDVKII